MKLKNAPVSAMLIAEDIDRARKFYSEKLDLRSADISKPAKNTASFQCGDGTMLLMYEREGGPKADHTVAGWMVDDIVETVEELRERNVTFEQYDMPGLKTDERGIAHGGPVKTAWFKDTEGNTLSIHELTT